MRRLVLALLCLLWGQPAFADSDRDDLLAGEWINGVGHELSIYEVGDVYHFDLSNECYLSELTLDGTAVNLIRKDPEIFCIPKPKGKDGALDALRANLPNVTNYEIVGDVLKLKSETGRDLLQFDRIIVQD